MRRLRVTGLARAAVLVLGTWLALAAGAAGASGASGASSAAAFSGQEPGYLLDLSTARVDAVLEAVVDHLRGGPLRGTYTFVVQRPGRSTEYVMEIVSDGDQRGLIRVTAPPREAGQAFLMDGDDLWLYNARLGRSLRLPPSGRTGAFLGSDVSYNDIVGRDLERDYVAAFAEESSSEGLIVLELTPCPRRPDALRPGAHRRRGGTPGAPVGRLLRPAGPGGEAPHPFRVPGRRRPVPAPAHGGGGPHPAREPDRGPPLRRGAGRRGPRELLYPAGPGKRVPVNVGPGLAQRLAA